MDGFSMPLHDTTYYRFSARVSSGLRFLYAVAFSPLLELSDVFTTLSSLLSPSHIPLLWLYGLW